MIFQNKQLQITTDTIITKSILRKLGNNASLRPTEEEETFFMELVKRIEEAKLNPNELYFEPMSNKSFSVRYGSYPIGRINLKRKSTYMQVLIGLQDVEVLTDLSLKEYISHIPRWIKYIKFCLKD